MAAPGSKTSPVTRIVHPITRLIVGGAQENTLLTAEGLTRRGGWQVEVLCGPEVGPEGSLLDEARGRGLDVRVLPDLVRRISPRRDLVACLDLVGRVRGARVVHTHSSKAGLLGRVAARLAGVQVVVHTVHGWPFHEFMPAHTRALYVGLERLAARLCQALVVVSARDRDKGLAHGIGRPEQYVLIRSGIELERFGHPSVPRDRTRRDLGIPAQALVVGSVTRLSPQKAPLDLVRALACADRACPGAWYLIVGDGALRPQVEEALVQTGLRERTVLTGLRRDVPELLAACDVFALSSLWEGLPRVLPQAMASGLPVVCTRADGSAEAVREGVEGFLTRPGQPPELGARLADLMASADLRQRMGRAGRARAEEFGAQRMVAQLEDLYRRLLAATRR